MTCQEIYDITMALMDEMIDNNVLAAKPTVDYPSTPDYIARTPRNTYDTSDTSSNVF